MAKYESDITEFMRKFLAQHPEEIRSQRIGRGAWWDKGPSVRTPPPPARHSAKSGGAEYTFKALTEADE